MPPRAFWRRRRASPPPAPWRRRTASASAAGATSTGWDGTAPTLRRRSRPRVGRSSGTRAPRARPWGTPPSPPPCGRRPSTPCCRSWRRRPGSSGRMPTRPPSRRPGRRRSPPWAGRMPGRPIWPAGVSARPTPKSSPAATDSTPGSMRRAGGRAAPRTSRRRTSRPTPKSRACRLRRSWRWQTAPRRRPSGQSWLRRRTCPPPLPPRRRPSAPGRPGPSPWGWRTPCRRRSPRRQRP